MNLRHKDFCVIILSHGRPHDQATVATLNRFGYTGDWYIILDNEDQTIPVYKELYGEDKIKVFDKEAVMKSEAVDPMDNFGVKKTVVYARYASYLVAKEMGYKYFMMCEDDHDSLRWRMNPEIEYSSKMVSDDKKYCALDQIIDTMLDYFITVPNIKTLCMAQSGDYIGGGGSRMAKDQYRRKAMGTFITRVDDPIDFPGTMNDDTTAYTVNQAKGELMLTTGFIAINTKPTQKNSGGNTDIYEAFGTYVKTFYSVMGHPSGVKVSVLFNTSARKGVGPKTNDQFRIHHRVSWNNTAPKILRQNVKKYLTS